MEDFGLWNSFLGDFFKPQPRYAYFFHKGRHHFFNKIGSEVMCKANCDRANNLSFVPSRMFTWSYKQKKKPLHMLKKKKGRRLFLKISRSKSLIDTHCPKKEEWGEQQSRYKGEKDEIIPVGTDVTRDFTVGPCYKV